MRVWRYAFFTLIGLLANRSPALAGNRIESWRQDIEVLSDRLSREDRSFTAGARDTLRTRLARLETSLPRLEDDAILVALSSAVALGQNAHTRFRLDPTRQGTFSTQFPIRIWFFQDGPYVVRTAPEYSRALACRVVAINGQPLARISESVSQLFAGNTPWAAYLTPIYIESPNILHGLRIIPTVSSARFTFEDSSGTRFDLDVRPRLVQQTWETWQELSPLFPADSALSATALAPDRNRTPLYLRHPESAYWFEYLPAERLVYFQFNISDNAPEGPTFRQFSDSLLAFIHTHPIAGTIVDLRQNSGGNLDVAREFMKDLGKNTTINRGGRLFVITGRCTFSAGLYHAAQLKQFTHATFVGEPVGDRLDYWAEGGVIVLPNSEAAIEFADGFHCYSGKEYPENRPYYATLSIGNLSPGIPVTLSSKDYFSGRDPVLETIIAHRPR